MEKEFGEYLKNLRSSRVPAMTQEDLAIAIGRGKMTISQFENAKNSPPQGELLEKIIKALNLSAEEEEHLIFLSAKSRKCMPQDIEKYFFEHPSIYTAIRRDMKSPSKFNWEQIAKSTRKNYGKNTRRN